EDCCPCSESNRELCGGLLIDYPARKYQHRRMAFESASQSLGPLHPQANAIILDCRDSRLWYAGELSKLILTQILKFSNDPHGFTNRDFHTTLGRTKLTHLGLR